MNPEWRKIRLPTFAISQDEHTRRGALSVGDLDRVARTLLSGGFALLPSDTAHSVAGIAVSGTSRTTSNALLRRGDMPMPGAVRALTSDQALTSFDAAIEVVESGMDLIGGAQWCAIEGAGFYEAHSTVVQVSDDGAVRRIAPATSRSPRCWPPYSLASLTPGAAGQRRRYASRCGAALMYGGYGVRAQDTTGTVGWVVARLWSPADRRRAVVTLATVAGLCGTGFALVYQATVWTTTGREFGDWTLRGASLSRTELSGWADQILDAVSVTALLAAIAAVAVITLVRLQRKTGLAAIGVLVAANTATWVLKRVVLVRPDLGLSEVAPATLNSMPSGHSTAAFSVVVAVLFAVPPRLRVAAAVAGVAYGSLTAIATISAGWHRAGDSVAAFLLVGVCAAVAGIAVVLAGGPAAAGASTRVMTGRTARWFAAAAAGTLGPGVALAMALAADAPFVAETAGFVAALLASGLVVVGSAIAVTAAVLVVLDRVPPESTVSRRPRRRAVRGTGYRR